MPILTTFLKTDFLVLSCAGCICSCAQFLEVPVYSGDIVSPVTIAYPLRETRLGAKLPCHPELRFLCFPLKEGEVA